MFRESTRLISPIFIAWHEYSSLGIISMPPDNPVESTQSGNAVSTINWPSAVGKHKLDRQTYPYAVFVTIGSEDAKSYATNCPWQMGLKSTSSLKKVLSYTVLTSWTPIRVIDNGERAESC